MFEGPGELRLGDEVYVGFFKNGVLNGLGTIHQGEENFKRGNFRNGELSGNGCEVVTNLGEYKGECLNGVPHGQGEILFTNKLSIYQGEFKDGYPMGQGKRTFTNGDIHKGIFDFEELSGPGEKILVDKQMILKGNFHNGELYGQGT